jgi:hypothetical protein
VDFDEQAVNSGAGGAEARVGMNSGAPPEAEPEAPGSWTLWVASKDHRISGVAHNFQPAHVDDKVVIAETAARSVRMTSCCR